MRISDWSSDVCSSDLFNKASLLIESRSWGQQRLVAIGLTLMLIVALAVGMTIFTAAGYVVGYLRANIEINADRKSVVWGKRVTVRVDLGGRRTCKKTTR